MNQIPLFSIRPAVLADVPEIMGVFRASIRLMQEAGNPTWSLEVYPTERLITEDVEAGHMLVGTLDDSVIACIAFDAELVGPEHHNVRWLLETDDAQEYTFLNRLAVHPDHRGRSYASQLIDAAERQAERRGSRSLRLDVRPLEKRVVAMYRDRGYLPVGSVSYRDITPPFTVLERLIPPCQFLFTSPEGVEANLFSSPLEAETRLSRHEIIQQALNIRKIVFIQGQQVPEGIERDGREEEAYHLLALRGPRPAGALRMRMITSDTDHPDGSYLKLERIAVLPEDRGRGYGKRLVREAVRTAQRLGQHTVRMHAQYYLLSFYQNLGFSPEGEMFLEADIPHISMSLTL